MMRTIHTAIRTPGIAVGTAFVPECRKAPGSEGFDGGQHEAAGDPPAEIARFEAALAQARVELEELAAGSAIFAAHLEMAGDPLLSEQTTAHIIERGVTAEQGLGAARDELCEMLAAVDDEYLRARADDVRDVCNRILRLLTGKTMENPFAGMPPGTIVVAVELTPSDTVSMDFSRITGLVTARGSVTSHVCIIARSKGIPALAGVAEAILEIKSGDTLIINGEGGIIIIDPDPDTLRVYGERIAARQIHAACAQEATHGPAMTRSGHRIAVMANAGSVEEVREALAAGADGIGLFRSEFLYMRHRERFPGEEEQLETYRAAAELCGVRPLVVRTLDIGGDKSLPHMGLQPEENPFLGWRGIRVSLAMPEVFRTQLRALLRASAWGNLRIMFPMITTLGELLRAKAAVHGCMQELDAENKPYNPDIALGMMIETPAAVLIADMLAAEADFFSIGTNDLTQYVMAADRGNSRVAHLYDPSDVAVRRSIGRVAEAARAAGIEAGICGEVAADLEATPWLLESGIDKLSVSASAITPLKQLIRTLE